VRARAPDRDDADDEDGDAAATPKPKRAAANGESGAKPRKKRRESADGTPAKPNGFTRELNVTPELSAWLERKTVSRPELTRRFWAYIKERGLQARAPARARAPAPPALLGAHPLIVPHTVRRVRSAATQHRVVLELKGEHVQNSDTLPYDGNLPMVS
jgi:hypothetical protein